MRYYVYTEEDKRSLIENIGNYSLPLKTFIRSNLHEWYENTSIYNDEAVLLKNRIHEIKDKNIQKILLMILNKPADNKDYIRDILLTINSIVSWDSRECELNTKDIEFILFEILPYKINAYDLSSKVQMKNNHIAFWNFKSNSEWLRMIHECYISSLNNEKRVENYCILLSLFYNAFDLSLADAKPFFYLIQQKDPFARNTFDNYVKMVKDPSVDLIDFIDKLGEIDNTSIPDMHWNSKNYSKSIIAKNYRNNTSMFGSNLFNSEYGEKNFLCEIKKITPEFISFYSKDMKSEDITFSISENDISFIQYEYQPELTVINTNVFDNNKRVVRMNNGNMIFVLFKNRRIPNNIYGISINPVDEPKSRMIMTFKKNPEVKYKLESGDVLL